MEHNKEKRLIMTKACRTQKMIKKLAIPLLDHAVGKKNPQDDAVEQVAQIIENSKREFTKFRRNPYRNDGLADADVQKLRGRMYQGKPSTARTSSIFNQTIEEESKVLEMLNQARHLKEQLQLDYETQHSARGSLSTRPATSLRSSFQASIKHHSSVNMPTARSVHASIRSAACFTADSGVMNSSAVRFKPLMADDGRRLDRFDIGQAGDCQLIADDLMVDARVTYDRRPKSGRLVQETIKVQENKGLFFDKIRHYSRIYNPKQKSKLVFDKIAKKPDEGANKRQTKVIQVALKDYEREINQRLNTFSTFAMSTSGWIDSRPFKKGLESIQKKAGMNSAIKPMSVGELWSKQFHAEVMNKAQHKKFRLRIQRYLHILHRQGQGNASISRLMLDTHISKPNEEANNVN